MMLGAKEKRGIEIDQDTKVIPYKLVDFVGWITFFR